MDESTRLPSVAPLLCASCASGPSGPPPKRSPPSLEGAHEAARVLLGFLPFVKGVLRRGGVADGDVPDVGQEVLLGVLFRVARAGPAEPPRPIVEWRAYLRVAATRAASRYRRREAHRGECLGYEPGHEDGGAPSPEDLVFAREVAEQLDAERATTPEHWRAFHAYAVDGVPVSQIAETEGVPAPTIYARIAGARRDLCAALKRRRLT